VRQQVEVWVYDPGTGKLIQVTHDRTWQVNLDWRE